ncbi:MAG: YIP1 family protein [Pseudomonadota bacterium]
MNNLELAGALATAPSTAFTELRERPRYWFPLLAVVLSTAAVVYWYYSIVDVDWLKDALYGNNPDVQKLPEADRAHAMGMISRGTLLWGSVIGTFVAIPIVYLLSSLYYWLAAKVTKVPVGFKHWFVLTSWSALPAVISALVTAILLATSNSTQIGPGVLSPLSLNELVVHRPVGSPGQTLLDTLTIQALLSWVLAIIGVRTWSGRSLGFSAVFVLLPGVVIYGIWAAIAFK